MENIQLIDTTHFPITLEMDTPSRSIGLTIDQVIQIRDTLYVLSTLHSPEIGDCAIGHVKADRLYTIPEEATVLKVRHFVVGHTWDWGKSPNVTYIDSASDFDLILKEIVSKRD